MFIIPPFPNLRLKDRKVASASSTLDFPSLFKSGKNYFFLFQNLKPSVDAALQYRLTSNNGSSYISLTNYRYANLGLNDVAAAVNNNSAGASAGFITHATYGAGTNRNICGSMFIFDPASGTIPREIHQTTGFTSTGTLQAGQGGGDYNVAAAYTGLQFLLSSGSFTSGTISAYEVDA